MLYPGTTPPHPKSPSYPTPPGVLGSQDRLMLGTAYDGYLNKCTVFLDLDGDGIFSQTEPHNVTDHAGRWILTVPSTSAALPAYGGNSSPPPVATAGTLRVVISSNNINGLGDIISSCSDLTFGTPLRLPLAAPSGASVISPLTTLIVRTRMLLKHPSTRNSLLKIL